MDTLGRARGALTHALAAIALTAIASCTQKRDLPEGDGMHPAGWDDRESDAFHARWLQQRREKHGDEIEKIAECRKCHGDDYKGGAVGVACTTSGCHTKKGGPEFCGTCHGGEAGPMPTTGEHAGAHQVHQAFCDLCHTVPSRLESKGHVDGKIDVLFSGLAIADGAKAAYDASSKTCSQVYCHREKEPQWKAPAGNVKCDFCHDTPPAETHQRWSRVAGPDSCATCHPTPDKPEVAGAHIDTTIEIKPDIACWTCHGTEATKGAPAPALDGSTDPKSPGVGAHNRHLDEALADRIGHVVTCDRCHPVPASVEAPGHIFDADGKPEWNAPATIVLPNHGVYDAANQTCVVGCHFDNVESPPKWTDDSGDARKCDACHGFPPKLLRKGTPHTAAEPVLSACLLCHPFSPETHVNGLTDLLP